MSADRCPTCDQPPGDSQRAREHPAVVRWSTFINAKRTDRMCPAPIWSEVIAAVRADQPGLCTDLTCSPRVDWRAKFFAAESDAAKDRDDARSWRNAIEGAKEPGDPVLRAIAELLSCTYLDAVPTPADDDFRRELAVAAKVANDERRAKLGEGAVTYSEKRDAAKWRKVEPLIERLCGAVGAAHLVSRAEAERRITEIASAILAAATKEPS